jgi:NAD(P)-dependent dehydrogenase (short-subunit alcohol dehydrogenase family)
MGKLDGRVALITASGRNIGRACALRFASEGADVIVNARGNADEANAVAEEVRALGRNATAVVADVADPAGIQALVDRSLDAFGRIDVLLNVAAIRPHRPFLELRADEWQHVRSVILDGGLLLTQAVLPSMVEQGRGSVVFFVGDGAWAGGAQRAHVSAAKMGLVGLCRGLASEFAPSGIRFNVVSPGRIDTSRDASWYPTSMTRVDDIPLGRLGSPDDIASACLFLGSDDSSYVTGQTLHVNGGGAYF